MPVVIGVVNGKIKQIGKEKGIVSFKISSKERKTMRRVHCFIMFLFWD